MVDERIKHIKEVKGWKVNHPYEAGNIIFLILIFLLTAMAPFIGILPLIGYQGHPGLTFNGIDLFKFFYLDQMEITSNAMAKLGTIGSVEIQGIVGYLLMGQSVALGVITFLSLIGLIFFIVNLVKGYLRKAKFIKAISIIDFIVILIFSISFITYDVLDMYFNGGHNKIIYSSALIPAGVMFVLMIAISIVYSLTYKDVVYEKDLTIKNKPDSESKNEDIDVKEDNEETEEIPSNIESIGNHAFAENQKLKVANIPEGISKLGVGAFANCLNLRIVNIPKSVTNIGFNCFFHCKDLVTVNYAGTQEEWREVKRGSNWLAQTQVTEINCSDGPVVTNLFN